jgi:hypothetical protein
VTTATLLIQAAYREGNLIAVGRSPTTDEQNEALPALVRLINGIFGFEMGENLAEWLFPVPQRTAPVAANYPQLPAASYLNQPYCSAYLAPYPPRNSRVVWGGVTGTLYFPEAPEPGTQMAVVQGSGAGDGGTPGAILTLNGNGRQIQDPADQTYKNTVTLTNPAASTNWFYRDDLGKWMLVADLATLGADNLFPKEFDDFFICALSKRLAPRYGKITAAETIATAKLTLTRLKARYRQSAPTVYNSQDFPRTSQSFLPGNWWL